MSITRNLATILKEHVMLEVEGIERLCLNFYVPHLQWEQGIVGLFQKHLGLPVASSALMAPRTRDFVAAVERFVRARSIPVVQFRKGERKKDNVMAERLKHFQPPEGVVFVGKAQEKTPVFRTEKRRNPQTGDRCAWIVKSTALVNHYYFTRVHPRLLRPGLSEAMPNAPPLDSALQRCFQQLEAELQRRVERAEIAASKLDSNATSLRNQGFQWFDGMLYNPPLGVPHPDTMEKLNLERTLKTMNRTCMPLLLVLLAVTAVQGLAQAPQQPQRVVSPEVQPDRRATFRFHAPNAKEVLLAREGAERQPMEKDEQGVWSLTIGPLEPDLYGYAFVADGVSLIDPSNPLMKPNLLNTQSVVHVPGPASLPWEISDIPHGTIHHHFYRSGIVGDDRDFYVYTPPGYDLLAKQTYPVLYLLHGFSDDANAWTAVGRAHLILDHLIAEGKAKPMLVVMPLGYGAPEIVLRGVEAFRDVELRQRNFDKFGDALVREVIPQVEAAYAASKDRNSRAIAGLSMGGAESLLTGLNNRERFAWVGAFSSGGLGDDFDKAFPTLDSKANAQLSLLWVACGTSDRLIDANRKFREWLKSKGIQHTDIETPGAHTWMVWRRNLADFAPLLFRDKSP